MKILAGTFTSLFLLCLQASASGVPLHVGTYDFPLDGGGGGSQATLGGVPVMIYCDDFKNDIYVPSDNTANVTQLTSSDLSLTRFGEVIAFTGITLSGGTSTELSTLNNATAAARYDMVAYLISLYNVPQNSNSTVHASNNQIQLAIWTLMDPATYPTPKPLNPDSLDASAFLEQAADWFSGGGATTAFLSNFEVVSDFYMTAGNAANGFVGVGGFQEQIVMTPEPRAIALVLFGLLGLCGVLARRARVSNWPPA